MSAERQAPRRLNRAESKARTRSLLLAAARRTFAERGYQAATVEDIAAEAGFSVGAVYSNFRSKELLFLALIAEEGHQRVAELAARLAEGSDPAFRQLGQDLAERADTDALLEAEFWLYAVRNPKRRTEFLDHTRGVREALTALVAAEREQRGTVWPVSDETAVTLALAMVYGLTQQRRMDPSRVPPELYGQALNWLMRGLDNSPPA